MCRHGEVGGISQDAESTYAELFEEGQAGGAMNHQAAAPGLSEAERMAGGEEIGWDSLPIDADGLGGVADWRDK